MLAIAQRMIHNSTGIDADRTAELARAIAAAHSDVLYRRLDETPGGGGRGNVSSPDRGVHRASRSRTREMPRSPAGATMGV